MDVNFGQYAAAGRHVLTFAMGAVTAAASIGIVTAGEAGTLTTSLGHIGTGVSELAAGLAPLIAMGSGLFATWSASHKSQIASINALPGVKVVAESVPAPQVTAPPKAS